MSKWFRILKSLLFEDPTIFVGVGVALCGSLFSVVVGFIFLRQILADPRGLATNIVAGPFRLPVVAFPLAFLAAGIGFAYFVYWFPRWHSSLLLSSSTSCQRVDLASSESLSETDPIRRKMHTILLAAIRDGRTRMRLEPSELCCRFYGTDGAGERELVPLNSGLGSKVIAAMKLFAEQNSVGNDEAGVQLVPILVGGHAVTLRFQSVTTGGKEGITIVIENKGASEESHKRQAGEDLEGCEYIDTLVQKLQSSGDGIALGELRNDNGEGPRRQA